MAPALPPSVLFVCTANMCRSPMAAALFKDMLRQRSIETTKWRIDSAGTWAKPGYTATNEAIQLLAQRGLDIRSHRSRVVNGELLKRFRLILTMEDGQKEALQIEFPELSARIFMLSEMAGETITVRDPMGSDQVAYQKTAAEISDWLEKGMDKIISLCMVQ